MTLGNTVNSAKLKKQLQAKSAKRRSSNLAATNVAAAQHGLGRNDLQPKLNAVIKGIPALTPSPNRTRVTTPQLLASVMRSIKKFGMVLPILIDKNDVIVSGHALWEAAIKLGIQELECRIVEHLDPLELEALSLALNRIGEIGEYDIDMLRNRMIEIRSAGIELMSTGFTVPEIDQLEFRSNLTPGDEDDNAEDGEVENEVAALPTSVKGDLFRLGRHSLLCGDAREDESYARVLGGEKAHASFGDPPYNCAIEGFVGGLGQHKHADFLMFSGKESEEEFAAFLTDYLTLTRKWISEGAVIFACMDFRQIDVLLRAGHNAGLTRNNIAVWNKGSGGMGGLYRSAHELIAVFCNGKSPATNNVALGVFGRDRTNVWTYPGANRRGSSSAQALADHPTPKPVELVKDALLDVTNPGDVVLDPFLGSGTTIIAAEQCDRKCCGIELDPKYVDRTIRRWERLTGGEAVHFESGLTFAALTEERSRQADKG